MAELLQKKTQAMAPFTGSIVCVFIPMDLLCIIFDFIFSVKWFFECFLQYLMEYAVFSLNIR